jgi:hypothetical protein
MLSMISSAVNGANAASGAARTASAHCAWRSASGASGDHGHGVSTHSVAAAAPAENSAGSPLSPGIGKSFSAARRSSGDPAEGGPMSEPPSGGSAGVGDVGAVRAGADRPVEMLAELGMVLPNAGYHLADRAGHADSRSLGR